MSNAGQLQATVSHPYSPYNRAQANGQSFGSPGHVNGQSYGSPQQLNGQSYGSPQQVNGPAQGSFF
jgi:hypothetical protein